MKVKTFVTDLILFIMKTITFVFVIFIFLFSCKKDSLSPEVQRGDIFGYVNDELGKPISQALVQVGPFTTYTDYTGKYMINTIPIQVYNVTVSKTHYIGKTQTVSIIATKPNQLNFLLRDGDAFIELSDTLIKVLHESGISRIRITTNGDWVVQMTASWFKCSAEKGTRGTSEVSFTIQENKENTNRKDTVWLTVGNIRKSVAIEQSCPTNVLKWWGVIGNGAQNADDSVYVLFNKPVRNVSVVSNWNLCVSPMVLVPFDGGKGVRFTYNCAVLGGEYPFTITAIGEDGEFISKKIVVPFYDDKLNLDGTITCMRMIDNKNECWISVLSSKKLVRVSLDNFSILQTIYLDFYPRNFTINPYNNNLYILSGYSSFNVSTPENTIHIYNPQLGTLVKKITLFPDDLDHPQYPAIYPYDIGFTKTGYGILLLEEMGASGLRWKIMDSAKGDTIYTHEDYGYQYYKYDCFKKVHTSYDKSTLIMTGMYGSCRLVFLDCNSHKFTNLDPSSITRGVFITPNRKKSKIFCGQLYDQFIIDVNGTISKVSYIDNRYSGSADFTYRDGDDGIIYYWDEKYFRVMDYNKGDMPMWCEVLYGLNDLTTSLDGNYVYLFGSSSFYKFSTRRFYAKQTPGQSAKRSSSIPACW